MQTNQLAGHRHPILFMKATHKKQVYIPAFTRHDGKVVKGHMKFVHVTDDHDEAKVASGQGSHSQKIAHGKLAAHAWFQAMPVEHKAALVMAHATDHQDADSGNARASTLRSKILKGEKPLASEWKAWGYVDDAKRQKLYNEISDAGKGAFFQDCMGDAKATAAVHEGMAAKKQRLEHQETEDGAAPAAAQAEEKPAPVAEEPKAAEPVQEPAKEPEPAPTNVVQAAEEKPAAAEASQSVSDTLAAGLKAAKPHSTGYVMIQTAQEYVQKWGEHPKGLFAKTQIKAGVEMAQKVMATAAKDAAYQAKQAAKQAEPKPFDHGELNVPGKTNNIDAQLDKHKKEQAAQAAAAAKVATAEKKSDKEQAKAIYADIGPTMVAQLGGAMKEKGNGDEKQVKAILEDLIKWQPAKFLTMAEKWQKEQAAAAAAAHAADPAVIAEKKAAVQAAKDAATAAADGAQPGDELDAAAVSKLPPGSVLQLYHEGKPNVQALIAGGAVYFAKQNGKEWQKNPLTPSQYGSFVAGDYFKHGLPKLVSKGHAGWVAPVQAEVAKQLLMGAHMAGAKAQAWPGGKGSTIVVGPSDNGNYNWIDSAGKWGAGFTDGQQKMLAGGSMVDVDLDAAKPIAPQPGFTGAAPAAAEEPKAAEPAAVAETGPKEGDTKAAADGGTLVLKDGHWIKQGEDSPAQEPAAAAAQPGAQPAPQHVLDAIQDAKLAESNVNAKPTNAKLQAIHDHAAAGDVKALLHMGFGVNTYGKLAAKLTNQALEAMGSPHKVAHGQKMGTHAGLADMGNPISEAPAAAAPAPEAAPAEDYEAEKAAVTMAEKMAQDGEIADLAELIQTAKSTVSEEAHQYMQMLLTNAKAKLATAPAEPKEPVAPSIVGMSPTATDAMIDAETAFNSLDLGKLQALAENAKGLKSGGFDKVNAYLGDAVAFLEHLNGQAAAPAAAPEAAGLADAGMPEYDAEIVYVPDADAMLGMAAKGDIDGLKAKVAELKASQFDNTAAYGEKLLEALKAKGVTAAPAAVAQSAALAAHEIHEPSPQTDPDGAKTAQTHAAAGNLAGLAAHISDLEKDGYPHTQKYAQELQAKMLAKNGSAAAAPKSIALAHHEIPSMPELASAYEKKADAAIKLAMAGDLDAVKAALAAINANAPKTKAYIQKLISLMEAKQGPAAAPAAPKIYEADLPVVPSLSAPHNVEIAHKMKQMALAGDMQGLMSMQMDSAVQSIGKLSGYAHNLIQALAAKGVGASVDAGPKDGDTKQGADGMLVFKDGHWHKVGTDAKQLKKLAASVTLPKMTGTNALKYGHIAKHLKEIAETQGAAGLADFVKPISSSKTKYMGTKYVQSLYHAGTGNSINGDKLVHYVMALQHAMAGTSGSPAAADPAAAGSAAAAKENLAAAPKAKPAGPVKGSDIAPTYHKVGDLKAAIADKWEQTGPQKGSNPGGKFKDGKGQEWYCKFPSDPETVKNELLAAKFYQMLGAKVPELRLVMKDGKLGIASKWVDGISKGTAADLAKAPGAHAGFIFDAWLANWDVTGLSNDNLMIDKDGKAIRVDVGGALVYRAQGSPKGAAFGDEVTELSTLLDASKNSNSAAVFGGISEQEMKEGARQLAKLKPSQIEELVDKAGPGTDAEKKALAAKLIARRTFILKRMKVKDQWDKAPVDESNITVNPADIPDGIDFFKHPEKGGQPLSSKEWLNKQNTLDSANLSAFAKKGDLKALKEYKYQAVDGSSGNPVGMKPITEHPSNHIQKQWASAVQTLQSIAYPPAETLEMPSFGIGGTIAQIASEVGAFAPHENVTTVAAEHRLGYFMKLAQVDAETATDYAKEKPWKFIKDNDAFVQAGKDNYQKNSPLVKQYISGVQGSGSINHVWSQGATTAAGVGINKLTAAIYDEALEVPENTQLWRWMDDDTAGDIMTKQLIDSPPGTVLQNTDSMCTSFKESWGGSDSPHFCSEPNKAILMRIRCADGAKVTPSYGSGSHWNERELTTLPGARFVVVSVTKGDHRHPNGIVVDCIMLPPDEGFVAQLSSAKPLNKSWSKTECPTPKVQAQPSKVIVFRRMPSPRQATAI